MCACVCVEWQRHIQYKNIFFFLTLIWDMIKLIDKGWRRIEYFIQMRARAHSIHALGRMLFYWYVCVCVASWVVPIHAWCDKWRTRYAWKSNFAGTFTFFVALPTTKNAEHSSLAISNRHTIKFNKWLQIMSWARKPNATENWKSETKLKSQDVRKSYEEMWKNAFTPNQARLLCWTAVSKLISQ